MVYFWTFIHIIGEKPFFRNNFIEILCCFFEAMVEIYTATHLYNFFAGNRSTQQ